MNIFKVLASGKQSFKEETSSAILAWFMNPAMEHGIGYSFLLKFLTDLSLSLENTELKTLANKLTPRLRSEYETQLKLWLELEFHVDNVFIDIIIGIDDDWIIAIENKIYSKSVSKGQLMREYKGLKDRFPDKKIALVYLVPIEEGADILDGNTEIEFESLSVKEDDCKALITWQRNTLGNTPSISEQFYSILEDERKGCIDPISEYTRHTIKALIAFISTDFSGYEYDRSSSPGSGGENPLTEGRFSVEALKIKEGYVGVAGSIKGLLKMNKETLENYKFQYTSQNMDQKRNWVSAKIFNSIVNWRLHGKTSYIPWSGYLPASYLHSISKDFGSEVFIGIRGGENALNRMDKDEIQNKEWQISTEQATKQWIDGELFCQIMDNKYRGLQS